MYGLNKLDIRFNLKKLRLHWTRADVGMKNLFTMVVGISMGGHTATVHPFWHHFYFRKVADMFAKKGQTKITCLL